MTENVRDDVPIATVAPPSSIVNDDLVCRQCGYNLRGLAVSGRCPECNVLVGLSMQSDLLRFSRPAWIGRVRLGLRMLLVAVVLGMIFGIARFVVPRFFGSSTYYVFSVSALLSTSVLLLISCWLATSPDPSGIGESVYGRERRFVRIGWIARVVLMAPPSLLNQLQLGSPRSGLILSIAIRALYSGLGIAIDFSFHGYLRKFSGRIPDDRLARRARLLQICVPAVSALTALLGVAFRSYINTVGFNGMLMSSPFFMGYTILAYAFALAGFCFSIVQLFFLIRYIRALHTQHLAAGQSSLQPI